MKDNRFLTNASWIMVGRLFQLALTFLATMKVARYLGPASYGKLTLVYSYVQLFIPLCAMGMNDIVIKQLVDHREENDEILGTMIAIRLVSAVLSMLCSILLVKALLGTPIDVTIAFLQSFSLFFQAFDALMYFYQSRLLSQKSGIIYALSYILTALFRFVLIYLKKDIRYFAFAMSLDYIVTALLLLGVYRKDHHRFRFSFAMAKRLLKKSCSYIFAGVMVVIYGKVTDILLLGKMVDETSVGYYGAATTLCNAWPFILTAIIDSAGPIIIGLFRSDKETYRIRLKQLYAAIFYIAMAAALMIGIFSGLIIRIAYGNDYLQAAIPLRIFAWGTAFSYLGVARTIWMQCEGDTRYETVISLFGAVCNIVLNYLLIRSFGIRGAALASVLTQFLTNFVFLFMMKETRENAKLIRDAVLLKGVFPREEK